MFLKANKLGQCNDTVGNIILLSRLLIMLQFLFTGLHTYGLLTKREVKMAGYWSGTFSACL